MDGGQFGCDSAVVSERINIFISGYHLLRRRFMDLEKKKWCVRAKWIPHGVGPPKIDLNTRITRSAIIGIRIWQIPRFLLSLVSFDSRAEGV